MRPLSKVVPKNYTALLERSAVRRYKRAMSLRTLVGLAVWGALLLLAFGGFPFGR